VAEALQHFEDPPHDLILLFDRLVGIGIGADGDGSRRIFRVRQFALQELCSLRLCKQLGFEIEPGRKPEIGMRRPRKAVDAAVLAAAIRIDRAVEGNVGRVVAGDDLAGGVDRYRGLEWRQLLERLPAVVEDDARDWLVTARSIRLCAPAAPAFGLYGHVGIGRPVEIDGRCAAREAARRRWLGG
jgi:hypothetical protein